MQYTSIFLLSHQYYYYITQIEWVEKHMGRDWLNRLILTKDKTIIAGDLLFDDKPKITGKA